MSARTVKRVAPSLLTLEPAARPSAQSRAIARLISGSVLRFAWARRASPYVRRRCHPATRLCCLDFAAQRRARASDRRACRRGASAASSSDRTATATSPGGTADVVHAEGSGAAGPSSSDRAGVSSSSAAADDALDQRRSTSATSAASAAASDALEDRRRRTRPTFAASATADAAAADATTNDDRRRSASATADAALDRRRRASSTSASPPAMLSGVQPSTESKCAGAFEQRRGKQGPRCVARGTGSVPAVRHWRSSDQAEIGMSTSARKKFVTPSIHARSYRLFTRTAYFSRPRAKCNGMPAARIRARRYNWRWPRVLVAPSRGQRYLGAPPLAAATRLL